MLKLLSEVLIGRWQGCPPLSLSKVLILLPIGHPVYYYCMSSGSVSIYSKCCHALNKIKAYYGKQPRASNSLYACLMSDIVNSLAKRDITTKFDFYDTVCVSVNIPLHYFMCGELTQPQRQILFTQMQCPLLTLSLQDQALLHQI